jgi:hypothetical protein
VFTARYELSPDITEVESVYSAEQLCPYITEVESVYSAVRTEP